MFGGYAVFRGGCAAFHVLCLDEMGIGGYAVFYGGYAVFRRGGYFEGIFEQVVCTNATYNIEYFNVK